MASAAYIFAAVPSSSGLSRSAVSYSRSGFDILQKKSQLPSSKRHHLMKTEASRDFQVTCSAVQTFSTVSASNQLKVFNKWFDSQVGKWNSERMYHYIDNEANTNATEKSQTVFTVSELDENVKQQVLQDNRVDVPEEGLKIAEGFKVLFNTVMEKTGKVSSGTNVLFVPTEVEGPLIKGPYLRDVGYEESNPIIGQFSLNTETMELVMNTRYSKVTSIDSITLVHPNLRVRRILNYANAPEGTQPTDLVLAGFGIEQLDTSDSS